MLKHITHRYLQIGATERKKKHAGGPNICTMDFVEEIEELGAFFARKFGRDVDSSIINYFCNKTEALQEDIFEKEEQL